MTIEFLCPNGHALSAPEDRAGRPAKCPKCAVAFRVPEHTAATTRASTASESQIRSGGIAEVKAVEPGPAPRPDAKKSNGPAEDNIVFLCPNGHKLNGPARLRGRPGQCPYCGAKFRIPGLDEEQDLGPPDDSVISDEAHDAGMRVRELPETSGSSKIRRGGEAGSAIRHNIPPGFLWPDIMANLWRHRPPGGTVEIHLADGKTVTPQWYAADLSGPGHGSFAVADGEGSYTLLSIAWSSVTRIEVHGVIDLPDEMTK